MQGSVLVVVITFNQPKYQQKCLSSLVKHTRFPYDLIVHHNYKNEFITKIWQRYIKRSNHDYILLLNDDAVLTKDYLERLLAPFEDPSVACTGPYTSYSSNNQNLCEYRENRLKYSVSEIDEIAEKVYNDNKEDPQRQVGDLIGFCYLMDRKKFLEVGSFNMEFGVWGQESELNYRFKQAGYKLILAKNCYVHHFGSVSLKKASKEGVLDWEKEHNKCQRLMDKHVRNK